MIKCEEMQKVKAKSIVKGCTSCPYVGTFELRDCPDAYTHVSHLCNLYSKEVVYNGTSKED